MRAQKGPRLWLRKARRSSDGGIRQATWVVLDRGKHIASGCAEGDVEGASQFLSDYIRRRYTPARKERDIEEIHIADVLSIYVADVGPHNADPRNFLSRIGRLNDFFDGKTLANVNGQSCRAYVEARRSPGGARRDLEALRAAINHHAREGFHRGLVSVWLPPRGLPRDRWLTRSEAAKLLRTCWGARADQLRHRGPDRGKVLPTDKRPLRHLARFILIGLYTGSRASAIAAASPTRGEGRSWIDLDRGIFYRLAQGRRATQKRQTPVPLPRRLLAHLRRWQRLGVARAHFVEWNGKPVKSVKTAFATAVDKAGLTDASPHTLRHTAATWLMQAGAPMWEAAGFLGMSEATLRKVYGHHHPDFMKGAVTALEHGNRGSQSLVVSLADARDRRPAVKISH
jgi:integrase